MKTCKYVHYEYDPAVNVPPMMMGPAGLPLHKPLKPQRAEYWSEVELCEPQGINCDIRSFRMDILGKFGVIMVDPPWDIHMELHYGTISDDVMRNLNVPYLQTDGLIFLWVTGRAMELGRECLELWGYKLVEEIIWVKTNQLQQIFRTGRTGHWLNHIKEHCLIGIKENPEVNRNIDTNAIVAKVRETSRKLDEMYRLLERISPSTRKLELFAHMHNTQAECQREILEAKAMVEEAERSLLVNENVLENGDGFMGRESDKIDKDEERWESIKAASVSAIVGTLAGLPITFTQVTSSSQLILPLAINFLSCALFGVTFRYTVRRNLDNFQLKTGTSAAFAFVKGLATLNGGPPLELNSGSLLSHALDGAIYVSENLFIFIFAAVGLDYCFKTRLLSPFTINKSVQRTNSK